MLPPRDLHDAFHLARGLHDFLEVGEVLDLDEGGSRHATIDGAEVHALDVGPGRAHGGGDVGVQAAPVVGDHRQTDSEALTFHFLPIDLQAALGLVRQDQEVGTVTPVNAHTAAPRHVADDRIAGYRLTALRIPHHEPVGPLNP